MVQQHEEEKTTLNVNLAVCYPASKWYEFQSAFYGEEHSEEGVHVAENVADQEWGTVMLKEGGVAAVDGRGGRERERPR